jgi:hypothetical protein
MLNARQNEAASFGDGPLLILAGAGTGKTNTLAHRVAHLLRTGVAPERILLLTFSRRAAQEMTRRAQRIVAESLKEVRLPWSGTFHAIANRLIRSHAQRVGLAPAFTVSTAATPPTSSTCCVTSSACRRRRSASRARTPASPSIRTASTRRAASPTRCRRCSPGAPSGRRS